MNKELTNPKFKEYKNVKHKQICETQPIIFNFNRGILIVFFLKIKKNCFAVYNKF
jgi:hypothetical protein